MSHLKRVAVLAAGAAITSIFIGTGPGTPANADITTKVTGDSSTVERTVVIRGRGGGWGRGWGGYPYYGAGFYGAGYGAYPYSPYYGTGFYGAGYQYAPPFYGGWGYGGGW